MRKKAKVALIWTGIIALAIAAYLSLTYGRHTDQCMLVTFQRYSDLDPYVGDVAFLNLTNTSNKPCRMFMEGNTNTLVVDTTFGQFKQSWLVQCEFSDRTENAGTNWIQQPSPDIRSNKCVTLGPHSAMVIRVPLAPDGQHRRVAVLYQVVPRWQQFRFWATPSGARTMRIMFRVLPRATRKRIVQQPILKAWCDREF